MIIPLVIMSAQAHGLVISSRTVIPRMSISKPSNMPKVHEDEAKARWLSRLDTPTWTGVVRRMDAQDKCEDDASKTSEDAAKQAWLAKLEIPAWGKASAEVAGEVKKMNENEAKQAWLSKLDLPAWGKVEAATAVLSTKVMEAASNKMTEEEAKKIWLSRLDAPSWGQAAKMMADVVKEALEVQDEGDAAAASVHSSDQLSPEQRAKQAWLARLDVPTWGAAAAAVSSVAKQVGA